MYNQILVPIDGSTGSERAADHALDLAEANDATIHALYVVEPVYAGDFGTAELVEAMRSEAKRSLDAIEKRCEDRGITSIVELRDGSPHRNILGYAEDNDIDLIVMGTHGRTGLNRYLLGSVTEKIVRLSDVPVLTVRAPEKRND